MQPIKVNPVIFKQPNPVIFKQPGIKKTDTLEQKLQKIAAAKGKLDAKIANLQKKNQLVKQYEQKLPDGDARTFMARQFLINSCYARSDVEKPNLLSFNHLKNSIHIASNMVRIF